MKKIGIILIILISLASAILIAKDAIIKRTLEGIVSLTTGLKMEIGELKADIPKTSIWARDIIVLNPPHFKDKVMFVIPELYIDYDHKGILKKEIHLNSVHIYLRELTIVKNSENETNIGYIKKLGEKRARDRKKASGKYDLQIDLLRLKIGKIIRKDYSEGERPLVSEYNINMDSRYRNVKNANEIVRIIISRALLNTAIEAISDINGFKDAASMPLKEGKEILKKGVDEFKNILKAPFTAKE